MKSREHVTTNGRASFYASIWNDLRQAALGKGWALALHGSLATDMDIMAMAWVKDAKPINEMIEALEKCLTKPSKKLGIPTRITKHRPNGRVIYTIHIFSDFYLDLNIIDFQINTNK